MANCESEKTQVDLSSNFRRSFMVARAYTASFPALVKVLYSLSDRDTVGINLQAQDTATH